MQVCQPMMVLANYHQSHLLILLAGQCRYQLIIHKITKVIYSVHLYTANKWMGIHPAWHFVSGFIYASPTCISECGCLFSTSSVCLLALQKTSGWYIMIDSLTIKIKSYLLFCNTIMEVHVRQFRPFVGKCRVKLWCCTILYLNYKHSGWSV